ncbi:hypothetical protein [Hoeflea sp.]|uniref:hypothetical protein n=1 Tax=Hoeflea sp. TaxID=1940281 RepID=UPI003BB04163
MATTNHRVRNFFTAVVRSIDVAREARTMYRTPDDVFTARGVTREQALRDLLDQL